MRALCSRLSRRLTKGAIAHRTSVSNEIEMVRTDGAVIYVQNDVEPLYDGHGNIYGCVSVLMDLS